MENTDGSRRRVIIPGNYCDHRHPTPRNGEVEVLGMRTWRSDISYLNVRSDSQSDYKGPGYKK